MPPNRFGKRFENEGLTFVNVGSQEDYDRVSKDPNLWHPTRGMQVVMRIVSENMDRGWQALTDIARPGKSVLIGHPLSWAARSFEEKFRNPAVTMHLAPTGFRSDSGPLVLKPGLNLQRLPRWVKRSLWWMIDKWVLDRHIVPGLNRFRKTVDLPPVYRPMKNWLHSPHQVIGLFPDWFGQVQPDWPDNLSLTGFPMFDEKGRHPLDPAIDAFLDPQDPPVVFTPGSANRQAVRFFQAAIDATQQLGRRALLLSRYPEQLPHTLPGHVRHAAYLPLSEVFAALRGDRASRRHRNLRPGLRRRRATIDHADGIRSA